MSPNINSITGKTYANPLNALELLQENFHLYKEEQREQKNTE